MLISAIRGMFYDAFQSPAGEMVGPAVMARSYGPTQSRRTCVRAGDDSPLLRVVSAREVKATRPQPVTLEAVDV